MAEAQRAALAACSQPGLESLLEALVEGRRGAAARVAQVWAQGGQGRVAHTWLEAVPRPPRRSACRLLRPLVGAYALQAYQQLASAMKALQDAMDAAQLEQTWLKVRSPGLIATRS